MPILKHLISIKVVEQRKSNLFFAIGNLDILNSGENIYFKAIYLDALQKANFEARRCFQGSDRLFMHSAFSVSKHRLPELKKKLQKLVLDLLDEEQNDIGDQIARVTIGLY